MLDPVKCIVSICLVITVWITMKWAEEQFEIDGLRSVIGTMVIAGISIVIGSVAMMIIYDLGWLESRAIWRILAVDSALHTLVSALIITLLAPKRFSMGGIIWIALMWILSAICISCYDIAPLS